MELGVRFADAVFEHAAPDEKRTETVKNIRESPPARPLHPGGRDGVHEGVGI